MIPTSGGQGQVPPELLQALMSGMAGGEAMPPAEPEAEAPKDWLSELLNMTHGAMISAQDPQEVSVLGKVIDLLTTVQAKRASAA